MGVQDKEMGIFLQFSESSSGFGESYPLPVLFKISKRGEKCYLTLGILHQRIPPRSPTFPPEVDPSLTDNLGVETFHKIIEDEFYECEKLIIKMSLR